MQFSKRDSILILCFVLVLGLFVHMILGCSSFEGMEGSNTAIVPTAPVATVATVHANSSAALSTSLVDTLPEVPSNTVVAGPVAAQTETSLTQALPTDPNSTASPILTPATNLATVASSLTSASSIETPNPFSGMSNTPTNALAVMSSTTATAPPSVAMISNAEGFGNLFSSSYSSPYWNNNQESEDFFANTKFKPECCEQSNYSNSGGCACLTKSQEKYLQQRGDSKNYY